MTNSEMVLNNRQRLEIGLKLSHTLSNIRIVAANQHYKGLLEGRVRETSS